MDSVARSSIFPPHYDPIELICCLHLSKRPHRHRTTPKHCKSTRSRSSRSRLRYRTMRKSGPFTAGVVSYGPESNPYMLWMGGDGHLGCSYWASGHIWPIALSEQHLDRIWIQFEIETKRLQVPTSRNLHQAKLSRTPQIHPTMP